MLLVALLGSQLVPHAVAQELFRRTPDTIPPEVETMYLRGLKYLAGSQSGEGNWSDGQGNEPGVVGIALLAMLAHGDDPNLGPYSPVIRKGLNFILSRANRENGYIGSSMYHHGFATLALAEAYGVVDEPRLGPALEKATRLIVSSQQRNPTGAWRYSPESVDADTTVSGAQMVALFAARNAGLAVPDEAIQKGLRFFRQCQTPDGGFGYTNPTGPNNTRTAIGLLVLALAREQETAAFKNAKQYLTQDLWGQMHYPFYHEYYAAQALFQADLATWADWNAQNIKRLAIRQNSDGSWDGNHGRCFSTGAALLSLALNYRLLPIYER